MRSLVVKLALTFTIVALLSITVVSIIINWAIGRQFNNYLERGPFGVPGGPPWYRGMGPGEMFYHHVIGPLEQSFLQSVNKWIWVAGLLAAAIAALAGFIIAKRMTAPLKDLAVAAKEISRGDLAHRVEIQSDDEIGQVARSFNAMARSIEKSNELRRRLLGDIVHEIKTPLTVVRGNIEAMLDGVIEPTPKKLAAIHTETLLLARLLNDLRDLSLAEGKQLKLETQVEDIGSIIRQVVEMFKPRATEEAKQLSIELNNDIPPALVDRDRISQVLYNLIANAFQYTSKGDYIKISARVDTAVGGGIDNPVVLVSVADSGEGISEKDLPYVFDHFYRVDESRARSSGGSGIGLAIVKHLIEAHGGHVWVKSKPGEGSTFFFTLPIAQEIELSDVKEEGNVSLG
ncbi:MAG: HAMP domain-containing protein [Firmicutes bacterium]|nr:HAMP domain-containing protein [Bacillota bacterium]